MSGKEQKAGRAGERPDGGAIQQDGRRQVGWTVGQASSRLRLVSIADDDLCSDCIHCDYRPGEESACSAGWPTENELTDTITICHEYNEE